MCDRRARFSVTAADPKLGNQLVAHPEFTSHPTPFAVACFVHLADVIAGAGAAPGSSLMYLVRPTS
jgi:hypothetical protein